LLWVQGTRIKICLKPQKKIGCKKRSLKRA
jgi:hypothetical protein